MTVSTRRDFIKTSAAAAAGLAVGRRVSAETGTLLITMRGLCCLVKKADGSIDLVLPTATDHEPMLKYPNQTVPTKIKGYALDLSGLPKGGVGMPCPTKCGTDTRWLADLSKLCRGQRLINYPQKNYDRKVASYLPLTGGSI